MSFTRVTLEFRRASFRVCLERNKLHEDIPGVQEELPGECSWKGIGSDREGEIRMEGKRKAERAREKDKGKAEERKERKDKRYNSSLYMTFLYIYWILFETRAPGIEPLRVLPCQPSYLLPYV